MNLPHWVLYAGVLVPLLGIGSLGLLTTDYSPLRRASREAAEFRTKAAEQRPLIARLAERPDLSRQPVRVAASAEVPSRWPIRGSVNSEFGQRRSFWPWQRKFHSGIDIGAARGTPVRAPTAGRVTFAGVKSEYGVTVILDHGRGVKTLYGHLQKVLVTRGRKVQRGQLIALTGNSGNSSGPHLHYETIVKGKPVNPRRFLRDEQEPSTAASPPRTVGRQTR